MKMVERSIVKVGFESFDGKFFDDEESCEKYEISVAKQFFYSRVIARKRFHEDAINLHKRSGNIRMHKSFYSVFENNEEMKDCYTTQYAQKKYKALIKEYKDAIKTGRKSGEPLYKWYMRIGKIINDLFDFKLKVKQAEHNLHLHKEKAQEYRHLIKNFKAGIYTDKACWSMLRYIKPI